MDPNETLREIRELIALHIESARGDYARLLELCEALDGWLSHGGFLPREWAAPHLAALSAVMKPWEGPSNAS